MHAPAINRQVKGQIPSQGTLYSQKSPTQVKETSLAKKIYKNKLTRKEANVEFILSNKAKIVINNKKRDIFVELFPAHEFWQIFAKM
jgi:hypothetical protein